MKLFKQPLLVILLLALGALLGGCETRTSQNTAIPWSRPATWENQIPGMGQQTGR